MHKHTPSKKKGFAKFLDFLFNSNRLLNKDNGSCRCSICDEKLRFSSSYYYFAGAITTALPSWAWLIATRIVNPIADNFNFLPTITDFLVFAFCLIIGYFLWKILNAFILSSGVFETDTENPEIESNTTINCSGILKSGIILGAATLYLIVKL